MVSARALVCGAMTISLVAFLIFSSSARDYVPASVIAASSSTGAFDFKGWLASNNNNNVATAVGPTPAPPPIVTSARDIASVARTDAPTAAATAAVATAESASAATSMTSIAALRGDKLEDHACDLSVADPAKAPLCHPCVLYDSAGDAAEQQRSVPLSAAVAASLTEQNGILDRALPPLPCDLHGLQRGKAHPFSPGAIAAAVAAKDDAAAAPAFSRISMLDLLRLYRNETFDLVLNEKLHPPVCIMSLFHAKGACLPHVESLDDCVTRLGIRVVEHLVPDKCLHGSFWHWYREGLKRRRTAATAASAADSVGDKAGRVSNDLVVDGTETSRMGAGGKDRWKTMFRGVIPHSTIRLTADEGQPWVPPAQRSLAILGAPLVCRRSGATLHPIGFAIPRSVMVESVTRTKAFDFMPLTPGYHMGDRLYRTGVQQEGLFREMYSSSFFAFTNNRGGYDCMRHYEILASGTIPYFSEIAHVPKHSLTHLPKDLLIEALTLPGVEHVGGIDPRAPAFRNSGKSQPPHPFYQPIHSFHIHFKRPGTIDARRFDRDKYMRLADKLLNFTRHHLTAGAMVAAMLHRMGGDAPNAKRVLLITRFSYDYLHAVIQNGFSELGIRMTIVGEDSSRWMYRLRHPPGPLKELSEVKRGEAMQASPPLYGASFSQPHRGLATADGRVAEYILARSSAALDARIEKGEFDLVIYTYIHNGMSGNGPYLRAVKKTMPRDKVAFLDHDDASFAQVHEYAKIKDLGHIFVRELDESRSCV